MTVDEPHDVMDMCSTREHIKSMSFQDEIHYRILGYIASHPDATQREVARALGVSVGKANYCIRALITKGFLKARNFKNSNSKAAYSYVLTPRGVREKVRVTYEFLRYKLDEYDALKREIAALSGEVAALSVEELAGEKR